LRDAPLASRENRPCALTRAGYMSRDVKDIYLRLLGFIEKNIRINNEIMFLMAVYFEPNLQ